MAKQSGGYAYTKDGKWYARLTYTDASGRRRTFRRRAETKTHAKQILREVAAELDTHGSKYVETSRLTFDKLADFYAEHYLRPAEFVNGRKVSGLRDWKHPRAYLLIFREHFGRRLLRDITPEDIRLFRTKKLFEKS